MMSGLKTVLSTVNYLCIACDISDMLEFSKKSQTKYRSHSAEVRALMEEGNTYHVDFLQFLILVKTSCHRSCAALKNIKMELEIVLENQAFDSTFLLEIQEASQSLKTAFESLYEKTKAFKKDMMAFDAELRKKGKSIKSDAYNNSAFLNTLTTIFRTCVSISALLFFEAAGEVSVLAGGGVIAAALLTDDRNQKLRKLKGLHRVTGNLTEQNLELYGSVDTISEKVCDIQKEMHIFFDGAEKTIRQESNFETRMMVVNENGRLETVNGSIARKRLVIKAKGMIEAIDELLAQLKGMEEDTVDHIEKARAEIRQENPRSLIDF